MANIDRLADMLAQIQNNRAKTIGSQLAEETAVKEGTIIDNDFLFVDGNTVPYKLVVDMLTARGMPVHCQMSNGCAIVIGA